MHNLCHRAMSPYRMQRVNFPPVISHSNREAGACLARRQVGRWGSQGSQITFAIIDPYVHLRQDALTFTSNFTFSYRLTLLQSKEHPHEASLGSLAYGIYSRKLP